MIRTTQFVLAGLCLLVATVSIAQDGLASRVEVTHLAPDGLLGAKSVVFFQYTFLPAELAEIQSAFQQIGIDAVAYFEEDKVTAGHDVARAYSAYFLSRDIRFVILLGKPERTFSLIATAFNGKESYVDAGQPGWRVTSGFLHDMLMSVYRDSWLTQKKENFLINDLPETDINIPVITGRRSELFPIDLKIDNLAIVRLADAARQQEVEALFATVYPYAGKYKFVDELPANEKDLKKQGVQYVLQFVHCRGRAAKDVLGYDITRGESAYGSVSYPNGMPQVKTISVDAPVYKFYIKHIESGNVFLGKKWDADESFVQGLKNHLMMFRAELNLN